MKKFAINVLKTSAVLVEQLTGQQSFAGRVPRGSCPRRATKQTESSHDAINIAAWA